MKQTLWQQIKEDLLTPWRNDPAINSKMELFTNYPGVWAIIHYRIANRLYKKGWIRIARFLMGLTQIITNVDIHPGATIGRRVFIDHAFGVVIGETAVLEDDVLIYQGVTLGGVNLDKGVKRHPTIKQGAVIGGGAKVLGDITIGVNSRIGANSVVVKDVPSNSTAVGIPARIVTKGKDKSQLSHNKLPDVNQQLFIYLTKRIESLEQAILTHSEKELPKKDEELETIYQEFIKSIKS